MTNGTRVSELPVSSNLDKADILPIVDVSESTTKKVPVVDILSLVWPVGSIFTAAVSTNPATLLGFGTWISIGTGRMLVGQDTGDTDFDTLEETGGAKTVTLTTAQMPIHTHVQDAHTHTQDAHTHTQNAHTHTQNAHTHTLATGTGATGNFSQVIGTVDTSSGGTGASPTQTALATLSGSTAAVNQNTTATNQSATATNQNTTATNQNAGGGEAHSNIPPYYVVKFWKRTA